MAGGNTSYWAVKWNTCFICVALPSNSLSETKSIAVEDPSHKIAEKWATSRTMNIPNWTFLWRTWNIHTHTHPNYEKINEQIIKTYLYREIFLLRLHNEVINKTVALKLSHFKRIIQWWYEDVMISVKQRDEHTHTHTRTAAEENTKMLCVAHLFFSLKLQFDLHKLTLRMVCIIKKYADELSYEKFVMILPKRNRDTHVGCWRLAVDVLYYFFDIDWYMLLFQLCCASILLLLLYALEHARTVIAHTHVNMTKDGWSQL